MTSKRSARATAVRTTGTPSGPNTGTPLSFITMHPATITSAWVQPLPNFHRPDTR
jgi:hypothetical protein